MRILICAKEVLDPDAVNNYALSGRLEIGADGKTITQSAVPTLTNGYDEQAMEAALRIRDSGRDVHISVLCVGVDDSTVLKQAAALGADEIVSIATEAGSTDTHGVARIIAAFARQEPKPDLVLCGRQASDDDQGVVPALVAEELALPFISVARDVQVTDESLCVTRVTPDGDEQVRCNLPAMVTVSSELGEARYPTAVAMLRARRKKARVVSPQDLGLAPQELSPKVRLERQEVPTVQGNCEFLEGDDANVLAHALLSKLRADKLIS